MKREALAFAFVSGVAALGTAFTGMPPAPREGQGATGSGDYATYCAPCHGASGRGDGVLVARMATAPADLSLLRRRNGGVFPSGRVSHAIDGRRPAKAHGAMPAWGNAFREAADERGEEGVKTRIQGIVDYVESLQAREPTVAAMALCVFSNTSLPSSCTETAPLEGGAVAGEACSAILACLNDPRCITTYCQASTIRQGWELASARRVVEQR